MTNQELKEALLNKFVPRDPAEDSTFLRSLRRAVEWEAWPIIEAELNAREAAQVRRLHAALDQSVVDRANYDDEIERLREEITRLKAGWEATVEEQRRWTKATSEVIRGIRKELEDKVTWNGYDQEW